MLALLLAISLDAERAIQLANEWKLDEAEAAARVAHAEALACDDLLVRARALEGLGIVARLRGDSDAALDFTMESLGIGEHTGDANTIGRARNALGRIHFDLLGDADAAREEHEAVLRLDEVTDPRVTVRALNNLGNLATAQHDLVDARERYARAATAAAAARDEEGTIAAEHNVGLVLAMSGEAKEALTHFARAEALDRRRGGAQHARILLSQSEAHRALGDHATALALLRRARKERGDDVTSAILSLREADLELQRGAFTHAETSLGAARAIGERLHDAPLTALELAYRAKLRLTQKRYGGATTLAVRAAGMAAEHGLIDTVAQASSIAGTAFRRRGDRVAAKKAFRTAIDAIEQQRVRVSASLESRQRFFEAETYPYMAMLELSLEENDAAAALEWAEAAKSRVLRDAAGAVARVRNVRPRDGELFVEYAVTDAAVHAFVVTPDGVTAHRIAIARRQLDELTARFARELALRNLGFRTTARTLYDLLLRPLPIASAQRLRIVPDQELWRVPFHALVAPDDRYVVERHEIAYAPSLAVAAGKRVPRADRVLLAASLDEAEQEIAEIHAIWGRERATVLDPASEERVRSAAPRHGIIHIAAHGVYNDADPMQSHLVLAGDTRLTARELMRLRLPSALVILSACDMGVGRPAAGEGLVGMSWGLLLAGASAVVAGKWEVDSDSTARLMVELHRGLATGKSAAASLRAAQLALLGTRTSHPFYWAGFAVVSQRP